MTIVGLDDTDSRDRGMCTTYVAYAVADALRRRGATISRLLLVRLNPAVKQKTRGNAALAVHTDARPDDAFRVAKRVVDTYAETADERTDPGIVVASDGVPNDVAAFSHRAVQEILDLVTALETIDAAGYRHAGWKEGHGRIGALAAIGAHRAFDDWTYEYIAYREPAAWGTLRDVDQASVFDAADEYYPEAWDTVDRGEGEPVCVPNAPGPILYGIRGDDPTAVAGVAAGIDAEPVHARALFLTNQGTDAHLQEADLDSVRENAAFQVTGTVVEPPETREGGHVFFTIQDAGTIEEDEIQEEGTIDKEGESKLRCAAFEPTKRFRDHVRALRAGDVMTVAGEVTDGTLKLEKFAVRDLVRTEWVTPVCPRCGTRMESAGADQGYRCRDCGTREPSKVDRPLDRDLELGWYEVPPCARRHIAKPLIRGGFDAPIHPER